MLISMSHCSLGKKTVLISDYCHLYKPLRDDLPNDVIDYSNKTNVSIILKNESNKAKTPEEKFFEIIVEYASDNDFIYYKKCED